MKNRYINPYELAVNITFRYNKHESLDQAKSENFIFFLFLYPICTGFMSDYGRMRPWNPDISVASYGRDREGLSLAVDRGGEGQPGMRDFP